MTEEQKPKKLLTPFAIINSLLFLFVIFICFYFFYIKKDFDFIIETSCDINKEQCFIRDCTNPDDCPPNGLEEFKRYTLNANDFKYCENEDCLDVCENQQINCNLIQCKEDEEYGETCSETILIDQIQNEQYE